MASLSLLPSKTVVAVGEQFDVRLVVTGADPETEVVDGSVVVDGVTLNASVTITKTHVVEQHDISTAGFTQNTSDPALFHGSLS